MDDAQALIATYGGPGLLVISFIAATIFPLSSEAAVYGALRLGMPSLEVILWASIGNCLGVTLNYYLGRWGSEHILDKTMQSRAGRKAMSWTERYGKWSLFLSWLPIIGDPLTILAGVMRVPIPFFILASYSVRVARYALLVWAFEQ